MEKMNGDMLEMILNSPGSRLTERVTKFLTYQVSDTNKSNIKASNVHFKLSSTCLHVLSPFC